MDPNVLEEIAYRNRPPLLEDASIRGPTRTPVRDAMMTLEERDAIEADYRWYRYSKFAFPWLLYILAMAATIFCLSVWQQVGDYKRFSAATVNSTGHREGIPFTLVTWAEAKGDEEAGIPKHLRNVRIAAVFIGGVALLLTFLTLCCKPRPKPRTALNFLWVIMFIAVAVLAIIAFAWGIDRLKGTRRCPPKYTITFERCESKVWKHTVQIVFDACLAMGALFSAIFLAWYSITGDWRMQRMGWRERERDMETERKTQRDPKHLSMHYIRPVRMTFLTIILLFTLAAVIVDAVFIVYIHEDRNKVYFDQPYFVNGQRFTRGQDLDHRLGWPTRNTRLRYALSIITIFTVLLNLIPFTHRLIAYIFAFFYFSACVMCFVCFGLDIAELREADRIYGRTVCSRANNIKCVKSPYIATVIIEFLLGLALLIYVIYEICCKCFPFTKSRHSKRNYAPHELKKHDQQLDSLRPVRCEVTGRVLTAKEYVYRWRFIAGTAAAAEYIPMYPEQPLYAAEGYVPDPIALAAAAPYVDPYGAPPAVVL